jgi:hypothetical protein
VCTLDPSNPATDALLNAFVNGEPAAFVDLPGMVEEADLRSVGQPPSLLVPLVS